MTQEAIPLVEETEEAISFESILKGIEENTVGDLYLDDELDALMPKNPEIPELYASYLERLATAMKDNHSIKYIELRCFKLTDLALTILKNNKKCRWFSATVNDETILAVCNALLFNRTVIHLKLERSSDEITFNAEGAAAIATLIRINTTIRDLDLSNSMFEPQHVNEIILALIKNKTIQTFEFEGSVYGGDELDIAMAFSELLQENKTLTYLNIANCGLGNAALQLLSASLNKSNLKSLSFGDANDDYTLSSGLIGLAKAIANNNQLRSIVTPKGNFYDFDDYLKNQFAALLVNNYTLASMWHIPRNETAQQIIRRNQLIDQKCLTIINSAEKLQLDSERITAALTFLENLPPVATFMQPEIDHTSADWLSELHRLLSGLYHYAIRDDEEKIHTLLAPTFLHQRFEKVAKTLLVQLLLISTAFDGINEAELVARYQTMLLYSKDIRHLNTHNATLANYALQCLLTTRRLELHEINPEILLLSYDDLLSMAENLVEHSAPEQPDMIHLANLTKVKDYSPAAVQQLLQSAPLINKIQAQHDRIKTLCVLEDCLMPPELAPRSRAIATLTALPTFDLKSRLNSLVSLTQSLLGGKQENLATNTKRGLSDVQATTVFFKEGISPTNKRVKTTEADTEASSVPDFSIITPSHADT